MGNPQRRSEYGLFDPGFWTRFMTTMRPYLLFVSGAAGLVGMSLVKDPILWKMAVCFIPFFLSYGLGQALTDVFQTDTDAISSPYRPLIKGELRKRDVLIVSICGLLLGVIILAVVNPFIFIPGIAAIVGLATYTFFKRRWWGGPPWNSWIVATLVLDGSMVDRHFSPVAEVSSMSPKGLMLIASMAAVFFAYANFVVTGYFKDMSADRSTGYDTFQVRFGWRAGAIYGDVLSLLAVGSVLVSGAIAGIRPTILGLAWTVPFVLGIYANVKAQVGIHRIRDEAKTFGPILNVVRAFLFYCYALVLISYPSWVLLILPFHIAFEIVVMKRPERSQV
ncbi:MAG: UbiA family prenyltransferase [Thermoplasmatota archaeon]